MCLQNVAQLPSQSTIIIISSLVTGCGLRVVAQQRTRLVSYIYLR